MAVDRLHAAVAALLPYPELVLGISPTTLLVNGEPLPADPRVREAAALLHDRDVLRLRFPVTASPAEVSDFLQLLTFDTDVVRKRGGPAKMWEDFGHRSIDVHQIDYDALLGDDNTDAGDGGPAGRASVPGSSGSKAGSDGRPLPGRDDAVWRALVKSMATRRPTTTGAAIQQRLLQIAGSADAIHALAAQAMLQQPPAQGSAMLAAQAAAVLTTFQRLLSAVEAQAPGKVAETLRNLAAAASRLDPSVVLDAMAESAESGFGSSVAGALSTLFDDDQIARMLAHSLAAEGRSSSRMAAALSTMAPDASRQQRVLRLARNLSTQGDPEKSSEFHSAWHSLEQMLSGPGDALYTSAEYSSSLAEAEARSHQLRMQPTPQLDGWVHSVSAESVKTLSVTLLLDLFSLEESAEAAAEVANDLAALAEDLLMSADYREAERVVQALTDVASWSDPRRALASRIAVDTIARSTAMRDMGGAVADFEEGQYEWFCRFCALLGPVALESLVTGLAAAPDGVTRERIESVVARFGEDAVSSMAPLLAHANWMVSRAAIQMVGRLGGPQAVTALLPLVRDPDPRKVREAVATLVKLDDPTASRAIAVMLKAGSAESRGIVIDALAASRARRANLLLTAALQDIVPLGRDHGLTLRLLTALRFVGDDQSVPAIAKVIRVWSWLYWVQAGHVKRAGVGLLASMPSRAAAAALDEAARTGDLRLRSYARAGRRGDR